MCSGCGWPHIIVLHGKVYLGLTASTFGVNWMVKALPSQLFNIFFGDQDTHRRWPRVWHLCSSPLTCLTALDGL